MPLATREGTCNEGTMPGGRMYGESEFSGPVAPIEPGVEQSRGARGLQRQALVDGCLLHPGEVVVAPVRRDDSRVNHE